MKELFASEDLFHRSKKRRGFGEVESSIKGNKDEWLTPPEILKALGEFDLDPCSPVKRPWSTAKKHFTIQDNGLLKRWEGRVWCNPPYGPETGKWLGKLSNHGNGIALVFARTETKMFHQWVWQKANAVFFFKGRLSFCHVDGTPGGVATGPSVLVAYGKANVESLKQSKLRGFFIPLKRKT